jgi:hypothetical protein
VKSREKWISGGGIPELGEAYARLNDHMSNRSGAATAGIGFGSALAMILSFQLNHSILWAILHGVCSWFYVLYRALKGNY